ncbi:T9SS type A sorting domain-containing protein [Hymenobacter sp. 15J16-1T3B]|uniref:T9SS type A sorting domain-containing protein n=1 Tax=Hymenobacter sp. 15J16-1T3B TaxID=2886941 RepID=UPI001D12ECFD|nr:T9SS type A sorting domain-containing protein [Hymenobacter sp. 15J16-1T3B]MCC3155620.1 T9SS type A sorting domain-containing protein [Hymenobacter sp. 15J16-1T3B]
MRPFVRLLLIPVCYLLCALSARAQSPQWQWAEAQPFTVNSVAADAGGHAYVTGQFSGTIRLGRFTLTSSSAGGDLLVAKFDAVGHPEWATVLPIQPTLVGGTAGTFASGTDISVHPLTGEAVVLGRMNGLFTSTVPGTNLSPDLYFQDKFVVFKLSASGTIRWAVQGGSTYLPTSANALALDLMGNSYVTGIGYGYQLSNGGSGAGGLRQLFVLSLSGAGAFRWNVSGAAPLSSNGLDVSTDALQGVYVVGSYFGPLTLGGSPVPGPPSGAFLTRLDGATGAVVWARGDQSGATALAVDALGRSYVAGGFSGTYTLGAATLTATAAREGFVARFSPSGAVEWLKSVGPAETNVGVAWSDAGPVALLKRSASTAAVIGLQLDGSPDWELQASGVLASQRLATTLGTSPVHRRVLVVGSFAGAATFGHEHPTATGTSGFLASLRFAVPIAPRCNNPLSVYPNPSQHRLTVHLPSAAGVSAQLVNLQGRVVRQAAGAEVPATAELTWNVADLPRGLYTLRTVENGQTQTVLVQLN